MQKNYSHLREEFEELYQKFNKREFVYPDPLQFLYHYSDIRDREIVGLIAASLAFGNVFQILRAVETVLNKIDKPKEFLFSVNEQECKKIFKDFKYRFVSGEQLSSFLIGVKKIIENFNSIENCFAENLSSDSPHALNAIENFVRIILATNNNGGKNYLLTLPSKGSACKRINLYLRWMVRKDEVDPGGWSKISPAQLLIPLDTHMWKICKKKGFTKRKQADLKTVLEITEAFKKINPLDPVKYDFALTRAGIRKSFAKKNL